MGLSMFSKAGDKVIINEETVERRHNDMAGVWLEKMRGLYGMVLTLKSVRDRFGKPSEDTGYWGFVELDEDFTIGRQHLIEAE